MDEASNIIPDKFDYKNGCDIMLTAEKELKLKLYDDNFHVSIIVVKCNNLNFKDLLLNEHKKEKSLTK